jgi:hypothetical protein
MRSKPLELLYIEGSLYVHSHSSPLFFFLSSFSASYSFSLICLSYRKLFAYSCSLSLVQQKKREENNSQPKLSLPSSLLISASSRFSNVTLSLCLSLGQTTVVQHLLLCFSTRKQRRESSPSLLLSCSASTQKNRKKTIKKKNSNNKTHKSLSTISYSLCSSPKQQPLLCRASGSRREEKNKKRKEKKRKEKGIVKNKNKRKNSPEDLSLTPLLWSVWVLNFFESEYYSNSLRELRGLTLWDKIWKNWIKYDLFLKKK